MTKTRFKHDHDENGHIIQTVAWRLDGDVVYYGVATVHPKDIGKASRKKGRTIAEGRLVKHQQTMPLEQFEKQVFPDGR